MGKGFNGKFHKSNIYKRFALSFTAVLILPVCAFSFLFLHHFYRIYQEKIIGQAQGTLDGAARELDRELEELVNIANYNSQRSFMEDYAIRKNYTAREITGALAAETVTHSILENIYYYNALGQETVYSAGGTYSLRYFARFYLGVEEESRFPEVLDDRGLQVWQGNNNRAPNLYYIIEWGRGKWWFFPLAGEKLQEILSAGEGSTVLLSAEGTQIFPLDQAEEMGGEAYYTIVSDLRDGCRLVRRISEKSLFAELHQWQGIFIALLFVVLLGGGTLVCLLSSYNERPVKELQYYCREKIQNIPNTLEGFEIFRFAMKKMEENVSLLKEKQKRDSLLLQLLFGWECDGEGFQEDLREAGLFREAKDYRVIMASPVDAFLGVLEKEAAQSQMELLLNAEAAPGYEYRIVDTLHDSFLLILLGISGNGKREALEPELCRMADCLEEMGECDLHFCVGEACRALSEIHDSYLEVAAAAAESKKGERRIYCLRKRGGGERTFSVDSEFRELTEALMEADVDRADSITDRLIRAMEKQGDNRSLYTAVYYNVLNIYYKALSTLTMNAEAAILDINFLGVKDSDDAILRIRAIREQFRICMSSAGEEKREEHVISRVLAFLDKNCRSSDLSVGVVADYFDMSVSNLSHQFRQQTGQKISDYIMEKKLEYAKELLENSDYRIQDIAEMLGYTQTSNFTRKFRQHYGMTPGEYRSRNVG